MRRIHRLVADAKLTEQLQEILTRRVMLDQSRSKGQININLDHSQVGNLTVAFATKQTRSGRGIPFWTQVDKGSNNAAIVPLVDELQTLIDNLKTYGSKVEICLVGGCFLGSRRPVELAEKIRSCFCFGVKMASGSKHCLVDKRLTTSQTTIASLSARDSNVV